jgi:hypothetical protein
MSYFERSLPESQDGGEAIIIASRKKHDARKVDVDGGRHVLLKWIKLAFWVLLGLTYVTWLGKHIISVAPYYDRDEEQAYDAASVSSSNTRQGMLESLAITPLGSLGPKGTTREHLVYYDSLYFLALQFGRNANNMLEVGCAIDPFAQYLTWIPDKTCVAPYRVNYEGKDEESNTPDDTSRIVNFVEADFVKYPVVPKTYDLIVCSQVVEHVPDPAAFMKKLIESAETSIISVPYDWSDCGRVCNHKSHHITLETILEWSAPYIPLHHTIIKESVNGKRTRRILVVFSDRKGNLPSE